MGIEILGLSSLLARFRTMPKRIDERAKDQVVHDVTPMPGHMRGLAGAYGRMQAKAASPASYQPLPTGAGVKVRADVLTAGAEYGGRRKPKRAYATQRHGHVYVVRRRATMQFKPFLGTRGYWFWPTVRKDLKGINKRILDAVSAEAHRGE